MRKKIDVVSLNGVPGGWTYLCPVCNEPIMNAPYYPLRNDGGKIQDGVVVWCPNKDCQTTSWWHDDNLAKAYQGFKEMMEKGKSKRKE